MPKKIVKKHRRAKKKNNRSFLAFLGTIVIIAVIVGCFLLGIFIGFKKGGLRSTSSRPPKIAVTKEVVPVPVLPTANVRVPILVYHYIEFVKDSRDTIRKSLDIIPPTFEAQIKTLKDAGYNFITASDIGLYLDGKKPLASKPIILTFDDGYGDFYTDVFPILKKYNVEATEYVISGVLGKLNYMTLDQVKEIVSSGLVEIGAHTVHHPNLKSLPLESAKKEIEDSKAMLESDLGIKVVSFAYPYGGYNDDLAIIVKKAGFTSAVTTKGGLIVNQDNRYTLHRIHPGAATGEGLLRVL